VPPVFARDDVGQKLAKAAELLNRGKAGAAASILHGVIVGHPSDSQAHMELGAALACLADNDDYDSAIAEEKKALELDPNSYYARKILGHIYTNLHKSEESIAILKEACAINPRSYAAHRDLGIALMTAGKNDEAMKSFEDAIKIDPTRPDAHGKLSLLYLQKDKFKEAVNEGKKAVKLDVPNPEAHLALANALLASGDKLGAIEPYETALQANFEKPYRNPLTAAASISGIGWAFLVKGAGPKELAEAANDQRQAIKIFPAFGPAYVRLAEILLLQGNTKKADAVYQVSIKLSQDDAGVSTAYAKYLVKTGRTEEAKSVLKKVLEKRPDYKPAAEKLAELDNERAS